MTAKEKALVLEELKKMKAKELVLDPDWKPHGRAKKGQQKQNVLGMGEISIPYIPQ